ncbi:hypothetical protein FACS1894139_14420 [Planctomycetales bacterium]|nr:hypothetical protein FACS1894107_13430 [Planctomycetales bacterium]GHS97548.1 hypothetical protein FACS1894108_04110 [Planctomycetales bacterium]GHT07068.1 hypothetical protein FACS1894139_14420 [Planctomycetales bacterium]GHV22064.1 hypothetical protein AGMMS49959_12260 [Planctomycetales bacterium]
MPAIEIDPLAVLRQVFIKVLDEQMFLFAEDVDLAEAPAVDEPMSAVTITYHGYSRGELYLALSRRFCRIITGSSLGVDESEIPASVDLDDAARELLNMTCGQFMTAYFGEEPVFDLCPPQCRGLTAEEFAETRRVFNGLSFMVDDNLILLSYTPEA